MVEEKEKPLTREDVLKRIEEHGSPEWLDLSHRKFEEGVDLSGLDLHKIILNDTHLFRAVFNGSNLYGANLNNADLQYAKFNSLNSEPANLHFAQLKGAHLENAEFRNADLSGAEFYGSIEKSYTIAHLDNTDLRGAKLFLTKFEPCFFYGTKLEGIFLHGVDVKSALHLDEANWGSYVIGEEKSGDFYSAVHYYRRLKVWYTQKGYSDIAGEFFYREMEARRKDLKSRVKPWHKDRVVLELSNLVFGYGERPWRVVRFGILILLIFALGYFTLDSAREWRFFGDSLYFSAVSFTALGYGSWLQVTNDWVKALGAFESFIGVFSIALFLITFVRKMTR